MRVAFYAPLKPPDHPVPSGDRRMAQLLISALARAGHEVELAARLRSFDAGGETERQARFAALGGRLAARILARVRGRPLSQRPQAWITYHLYYKAPDWIGPRVAAQLAIPYIVIEASVAAKRAGGLWSLGHEATIAALKRAAAVISLNPADDEGVMPRLESPSRLHRLKPFLDAAPYAHAARTRRASRLALGRRFALPLDEPWLVTVAMMRRGDKLASYRLLGPALGLVRIPTWRLLIVGDGVARPDVEAALAPLGERVTFAGAVDAEAMPDFLAAADLFIWPAINEAYGMALLEAQAAGLPVIAGRSGGVPEIVADGRSGILTPPGNVEAFAASVDSLLSSPARRQTLSAAALAKVAAEHDIAAAGRALDRILSALAGAAP